MQPLVRRATVDDADLLSSLNADVQAIHAAAVPWRFKPPGPDAFSAAAAAALFQNPNNLLFIAEIERVPAGYVYAEVLRRAESPYSYPYETVYLHHLSVRPDHRRSGAGQALIDAVRAAGQELGITMLTLDVWSFNEEARAFFRRQGFSPYIERLWSR